MKKELLKFYSEGIDFTINNESFEAEWNMNDLISCCSMSLPLYNGKCGINSIRYEQMLDEGVTVINNLIKQFSEELELVRENTKGNDATLFNELFVKIIEFREAANLLFDDIESDKPEY